MFHKLTIIGPGLLGGSIGLAVRQRQLAGRVVVWARRPEAADRAVTVGAADEATIDLAKAVSGADIVILATPIGIMEAVARQLVPALSAHCIVTDVGSVKYPVVTALSDVLDGKARFVGSHPMAGSEQTGIEAARANLFEKSNCIITPRDDTDKAALQAIHDFWQALGCAVWTLSPTAHDEIVARVSHLPHLVAVAVVNLVCREGDKALNFVGPGFRDATRIAAGSPTMWTEICLENNQEIRRALDGMIEELGQMRAALENSDAIELRRILGRAKHYRDELKVRGES
jgi:prephenate dehydrogenase